MNIGFVEEWSSFVHRRKNRPFRIDEPFRGNEFPLLHSNFIPDIVKFYQLGLSSKIPVLQFLSFYQVLEYFFLSVSDERLYDRMETRIRDLKFRTNQRTLDRLIQDVLNHKRITDETEMLKNVLEKFIVEDELIEFIAKYEEYLGVHWYSKRRKRFGVELEVKLVSGHIFGNIAKVIKSVRNALVHSSDQYDRAERHVPFSKGTKIIETEIPLLKYLAERVVIATAR